ncbi:type II toxin-antitoxin system VapB family antitoxin [Microlunatus elymi]|uniref:Type II toxin-antitoxin system VapB family antitoxin n=1 Tax=Microlunatus elymi TaxID=2596828 RepID=A0A516PZ22_9ACTN|nr:type II toxin-antitoxin system VapB family antitoxin [Microlunatus elymi]QDP96429.1 type II toxin-antitoxin system VapB family antitoxin [Microlunatus elymi]
MASTQIDIDDDALDAAMRLAGVRTKKEMVNLALREYAQRRARSEARLRYFAQAQSWDDEDFWRRHEAEKDPE